jgi:hypothetical protein
MKKWLLNRSYRYLKEVILVDPSKNHNHRDIAFSGVLANPHNEQIVLKLIAL